MNFKNKYQEVGETVERKFDLDPLETFSSLVDEGAEGVEEYSPEGNEVINVTIKANLRINTKEVFDARYFNSIDEAKKFHRDFVEKLDELLLEYEL